MKNHLLIISEITVVLAGLLLYWVHLISFPIIPLFLVAWVSLRIRHMGWREVGFYRPAKWLPTVGLAVAAAVGYQALDIFAIVPALNRLTGQGIDLSQVAGVRGDVTALLVSLAITWTLGGLRGRIILQGVSTEPDCGPSRRTTSRDVDCHFLKCSRLWGRSCLSRDYGHRGQYSHGYLTWSALYHRQAESLAAYPDSRGD
jgi:hypothetical protein